ncbi:MAG: serine hydrolase [Methylocystis sp.]|uniref:serine hydrolase n=1 Tax=Methylocystis sp. TaxID=1911079 RepID=UPI0039241FA6
MSFTRRSALLASGYGAFSAAAFARSNPQSLPVREPTEKQLKVLNALIVDVMKKTGVPGLSVAVVTQDRAPYLKGFGLRRADSADQVDPDTVFQLASLSKPLSATVVAGLVGDGAVSWDHPIARSLPDFAMSDPWVTREITLRDMFCHRSGLPDHAGDLIEDIGYGRDEIMRRLRYIKPDTSFRTHYAYNNMGFSAAGFAAAKAAGKSWEEVCEQRLYRPLGMASASSRHADFVAHKNRAFGHVRRGGKWVVGEQRNPDAQAPAGGASASARDMATWIRMQLGGGTLDGREIIRAEALTETHFPHIATGPAHDPKRGPTFYGLGWDIDYGGPAQLRWSHSGAFSLGASTCVYVMPAERFGIVVLSNSAPVGAPETICRSFLDIVLTGNIERDWLALFGEAFAKMAAPTYGLDTDYAKPLAIAPALGSRSTYVGEYRNALYGPIGVVDKAEWLSLNLGPAPTSYPLHHYSGDIFTFQPRGENAGGLSPVRFSRSGEEKATSVIIDYFNANGQGVFVRD